MFLYGTTGLRRSCSSKCKNYWRFPFWTRQRLAVRMATFPILMVRVTLESPSTQDLADWAIKLLDGLGYTVSPKQRAPETPQQLATRLNLSRRLILRRLAHPGCPQVRVVHSQGGRVSLIFATPEFEAFLKRLLRGADG